MCGIWGIIDFKNKLSAVEKYYLARMLAVQNEGRGKDAAGFAWVDNVGRKHIHKCDDLARNLDFDLIKDAPFIVGHTRQGTIGDKTVVQAHPFSYRDHILTHNGTCFTEHSKFDWAQGPSGVDSETLLRYIVATGGFTKDNLKAFAKEWNVASYALGTILPDNTFISVRETNPFKYTVVKDSVVVYSSDEDHLKNALIFLGIPYHSEGVKTYEETEMLTVNADGLKIEKYRDKKTYGNYNNYYPEYDSGGDYNNRNSKGQFWNERKYGKGNTKNYSDA